MRLRPFHPADTESVVALWEAVGLTRPWNDPRKGVVRALIDHVEDALCALGCPKVNIQLRGSNSQVIAFYENLGYAVDNTIGLGKRLIEDSPPGVVE